MTLPRDLFDSFAFTAAETAAIAEAKAGKGDTWTHEGVEKLKKRIKALHLAAQGQKCCYCRRGLKGEFSLVIDIEHVLPKKGSAKGHGFPDLMFEILNLSVACKRCNMNIKRTRTDFVDDVEAVGGDWLNSERYRFVHPNLDPNDVALQLVTIAVGGRQALFYSVQEGKGRFTFDFFKLRELVVDSLDGQQKEADQDEKPQRWERIRTLVEECLEAVLAEDGS